MSCCGGCGGCSSEPVVEEKKDDTKQRLVVCLSELYVYVVNNCPNINTGELREILDRAEELVQS